MIKKIVRFWRLIKYFFTDEEFLFFYLLEWKAEDCISACNKLDVRSTEELEDLLIHLKIYREIPEVITEMEYPHFKKMNVQKLIREYKQGNKTLEEVNTFSDFLVELETERAVERDIIFDLAKNLTFVFKM